MRVLVDASYLTNKHLRGIGRYSQTLCRLIHQQHIAELYVLVCTIRPRNILHVIRHLRDTAYKVIVLPVPGRIFHHFHTRRDLYSIVCKALRIDLLHVPYETFYRTKFPNLMTVHGMEPFSQHKTGRFYENFRVNLLNSTETVWSYITVSSMVKRELIRYLSVKEERVFEVPIPLDDIFSRRRHKSIDSRELRILYYGGFEENKNLRNLVQALDHLRNENSIPFCLRIAGDPRWHAEKLSGFLERTYLKTIGYLDRADLISEILAASCVIIPSLYEGFGLPLIESLALRTPVLVSNNVGALSYAKQGFLVFDPLNQEDIARAIRECSKRWNELALAAERESKDVKQNLSFERIAGLLKDAYCTTVKAARL